jgi:alpha-glucosidase
MAVSDSSSNAGFTSGRPRLPVGDSAEQSSVDSERRDPYSLLALYRRLIALRISNPVFQVGQYAPAAASGSIFAFRRHLGDQSTLVGLNVGDNAEQLTFRGRGTMLLSTHLDRESLQITRSIKLRPYEGVIVSEADASSHHPSLS